MTCASGSGWPPGARRGPRAAVIDSQSVKGSEMIAGGRRGYDAGKKINGTKRHIAVDTLGLLLTVLVTAASRPGPRRRQAAAVEPAPRVPLHQADLGRRRLRRETGHLGQDLAAPDGWRSSNAPMTCTPSKSLPRRWVVERTLSWITRHRRTVRDYERLAAHHETYVYWAMIIVMTRRLARQPTAARPHDRLSSQAGS